MIEFICRRGHIGQHDDYCRTCLRDNFSVRELPAAPAPSYPAVYLQPEEVTPVITPVKVKPADDTLVAPVDEGAQLPVAKHTGKKR